MSDAVSSDSRRSSHSAGENVNARSDSNVNREAFLNMVAQKLGRPRLYPGEVPRPRLGRHPAGEMARLDMQVGAGVRGRDSANGDLAAIFARVFESQKGYAVRVTGRDGVHQALADIVRGYAAPSSQNAPSPVQDSRSDASPAQDGPGSDSSPHDPSPAQHGHSDALASTFSAPQIVMWDDDRLEALGVADFLTSQGVKVHRWGTASQETGDGSREIASAGDSGAGEVAAHGSGHPAVTSDGEAHPVESDGVVDRVASATGVANQVASDTGATNNNTRDTWSRLAESCQIGITWADGVCAETGTFLLNNRGVNGRLVSLLPRHHVVIFRTHQVVPRLTQLMYGLHQLAEAGELPAYTNLIAGPSGSADIAMEYIQGVHGPGTVTAIIVDDDECDTNETPHSTNL